MIVQNESDGDYEYISESDEPDEPDEYSNQFNYYKNQAHINILEKTQIENQLEYYKHESTIYRIEHESKKNLRDYESKKNLREDNPIEYQLEYYKNELKKYKRKHIYTFRWIKNVPQWGPIKGKYNWVTIFSYLNKTDFANWIATSKLEQINCETHINLNINYDWNKLYQSEPVQIILSKQTMFFDLIKLRDANFDNDHLTDATKNKLMTYKRTNIKLVHLTIDQISNLFKFVRRNNMFPKYIRIVHKNTLCRAIYERDVWVMKLKEFGTVSSVIKGEINHQLATLFQKYDDNPYIIFCNNNDISLLYPRKYGTIYLDNSQSKYLTKLFINSRKYCNIIEINSLN